MNETVTRRDFLKRTSTVAAGIVALDGLHPIRAQSTDKVRIAVIGCTNRGMDHIRALLSLPQAQIVCICDVDRRAAAKGAKTVADAGQTAPKTADDLRRVLEDPAIDAVSIATPDHWHTPAAIMACAAGKHVYVEKPGSHNGQESELILAAARKHQRLVQMGTQRRSWPWVQEAIQAVHGGELGKVFFARTWYTNHRASIGRGHVVPVPEWLDYSLWQGPAPERPFHNNVIHYNWHWFWNWGTGELGNNGIHSLDLARWGLQVDLPHRVTCGGNRYHYRDDWETPDTSIATYDYGDKGIAWEGQSCDPRGFEGSGFGVTFYGEHGAMVIGDDAKIYDLKEKLVRTIKPPEEPHVNRDAVHFSNFLDAIRGNATLNQDIAQGQTSTLLCHLGNIAWRGGRTINFDPTTRKIIDDDSASALWKRDYRPGWEPQV